LIATTTLGGKAGWSPAARSVVETRQSVDTEPLTPFAGDLAWHAELSRYAIVAKPFARQEHDLRSYDIAIRRRILLAARLKFGSLIVSQLDHERASPRHDDFSMQRRALSCRHESAQKYVIEFVKRST
jgi:hypothetical protein